MNFTIIQNFKQSDFLVYIKCVPIISQGIRQRILMHRDE